MKYTASEKREIIRMVEESSLSVKQTLREIDVSRSSFYERYHEAIDNVTPADKYYGRDQMVLERREKVRRKTMKMRRELNRLVMLEALPNGFS